MSRPRKNIDDALLIALACGATLQNAVRQAGIGERTARRRAADPAFQQRLRELRTDMAQRSLGMLTASNLEAIKILVALLDVAQPATVRLGAARAVLELGFKLRDATDLIDRIAALETQLDNGRAA